MEHQRYLRAPTVVTFAFTCEQLLKALLYHYHKRAIPGHDSSKLFAQLPTNYQTMVREQFKTKVFEIGRAVSHGRTSKSLIPLKLFSEGIAPEEGAIKYQQEFVLVLKWLARDPELDGEARAQHGKEAAMFLWKHGDEEISLNPMIHGTRRSRSIPSRLRSTER